MRQDADLKKPIKYNHPTQGEITYDLPEYYKRYQEGNDKGRRSGKMIDIAKKIKQGKINRKPDGSKRECDICGKSQTLSNFFKSGNPLMPDGRIGICKTCIHDFFDFKNVIDFQYFLVLMYLPFLESQYLKVKDEKNPIGNYLSTIAMNQYANYEGAIMHRYIQYATETDDDPVKDMEESLSPQEWEQLTRKWGAGFKKQELIKLEMYCNRMEEDFPIDNAAQREYLHKAAITSVMMDRELSQGNANNFKNLLTAYDKIMQSAQFAESQRKNNQSTINSISALADRVEKKGFIPWEVHEDPDIVDKTEQNIFEWTRDLVLGEGELRDLVEGALKRIQEAETVDMSNTPERQSKTKTGGGGNDGDSN